MWIVGPAKKGNSTPMMMRVMVNNLYKLDLLFILVPFLLPDSDIVYKSSWALVLVRKKKKSNVIVRDMGQYTI